MKLIKKAKIVKKNNKLLLKDFYTDLSTAEKEIQKRWCDNELKEKVKKYLDYNIPSPFLSFPRAVLARHVITLDFELFHFLNYVKQTEIKPLLIECPSEKFTPNNPDKYHSCRMFFYDGKGKNGGNRISAFNIVDFNKCMGKKFENINTIWGENLVTFHRKFLSKIAPQRKKDILDISVWFDKKNHSYDKYLALFICNGILFENFLLEDEELPFTQKKVVPSFNRLIKIFNVNPLIVPVVPVEKSHDIVWSCFPNYIKKYIQKKL